MSYATNSIAVMCGGAAGAVCRFTMNRAIMSQLTVGFPVGILTINVLGGLLMGMLQGLIARSGSPHTVLYSLLGTGFLGGFTTFSTFSIDTYSLYAAGAVPAAVLNIIANAALCIAAAGIGYFLTGARMLRS